MKLLEGKVALITGAARGIGKAIAESLHAAGADCYLTGTKQDEIDRLNEEVLSTKTERKHLANFTLTESVYFL